MISDKVHIAITLNRLARIRPSYCQRAEDRNYFRNKIILQNVLPVHLRTVILIHFNWHEMP